MKNPQQLDFEKQLKRLSEYGIKCKKSRHYINIDALASIGYYDLKRFAFPFNIAKHKGRANFKNISFDQLVTRYYQDKNLRIYILHAIECIEVYLENTFAYILGREYGPFGYLNFSSWCDRKNNDRFYIEEQQYFFKKNLLKKMKYASNPSTINQKNLRNGFPTVWLMVSTLTLGQLKKYIELASPQNRKNLALFFNVNNVTLESWIDCLVLVRNICCHNSDLIDIKLKTHPKVPKKYAKKLYKDDNNRYSDRIGIVIFIIVSMMNYINHKYDFGDIYRSIKTIVGTDNKLANQLGFSNYKSINALPRTRDHKSKKNKPPRNDMTPKFRTNLGVIFMSKLSKQDKIEIYHLWHDYQISPAELSQRYRVGRSNINYLLALIGRHGLAILDQPFTAYTSNFKEQALRRIIVEHETARRVSIDLGLKSSGMLSNWLREYRKNGYNIVNKQRGRPPHDQKRTADQTGKSSAQARKRTLTPAELEAENRGRIRKKIERLSRPADQEPQAAEIAQAVTHLRRELKVSVTFILDTINANPNLPHLSRSNYYYTLKKKDKERDNREIMAEIKAIYEEHKHRYGYRRITAELRRRGLLVNHKKVQRLMNKLKLFGIVSKRWHKYSSYRGTQGPIKPDLIKRSFSAVYPNHKWYSDVTEFKLKGQKTYLSPIIDGCTQEIVSYTISRSPNLKQTMDMLRQAWRKHPALNGLIFHTDQGWQYQHPQFQAWLKNHGISQSMSRKGNSLDDGLMEGFFGILKREMFYGFEKQYKNLTELEDAIRDYIEYYNQKRIKIKLKGLTPLEYRKLVLS